MNGATLLLADDDAPQRAMLAGALEMQGHQVLQAPDGVQALEMLRGNPVDLLLTDLRMPGLDGLELLTEVRGLNPLIPVVVMTAYGTIEDAVRAMQEGAFTFVTKPVELPSLFLHVERALELRGLREEVRDLRLRLGEDLPSNVVAQSPAMREVLGLVARAAPSRASVLVLGESGTGKEVVARALHLASPRRDRPFVAVNIAAIPDSLVESELFGHEKGAFTGAVAAHAGRFERAAGGTLFIDEVGDMPLHSQVKLLRVLQEGSFERVGGDRPVEADVRVVAATHRDLEEGIRQGSFSEDLFYRLNVVRIHLPPLRERKTDIPPLVEWFLERAARRNDKPVRGVEAAALDLLVRHTWPGNVRELENAVESAVVLARGDLLTVRDLPDRVRGESRPEAGQAFPGDDPALPLAERVERFERHFVLKALEETGGNKTEAARRLQMSDKNIRDRLKRWGG
jgi:DNA-binding NtrC family response regulator